MDMEGEASSEVLEKEDNLSRTIDRSDSIEDQNENDNISNGNTNLVNNGNEDLPITDGNPVNGNEKSQSPLLVEQGPLMVDENNSENVTDSTGSSINIVGDVSDSPALEDETHNLDSSGMVQQPNEVPPETEGQDDDIIVLESHIRTQNPAVQQCSNVDFPSTDDASLTETSIQGLQTAVALLAPIFDQQSVSEKQPASDERSTEPDLDILEQQPTLSDTVQAATTPILESVVSGNIPTTHSSISNSDNAIASTVTVAPTLHPTVNESSNGTISQQVQSETGQLDDEVLNPPHTINEDSAETHSHIHPQLVPEIPTTNATHNNDVSSKYPGLNCPEYLKDVLDPVSVRPYRGEIPPKHFGFLTPDDGYRCEECGDIFGYKTCLEFHLQRRSVIIEANCSICRQPLVFFNKCVFYSHIRGHGIKEGEIIIHDVNVKPITWQLMELAYEDTAIKRMLNWEELLAYETGGLRPSPIWSQPEEQGASTSGTAAEKQPVVASASTLATILGHKSRKQCSECKLDFINASALRQHFMYNMPPFQKQLICTVCQAVYFSQCSFKAHVRNHSVSAPFVCPECGSVEADSNSLNKHVMSHQRNPTVMDAWRCQTCSSFYSGWDALIVHIGVAHCDSYYRCQLCPMAFQSQASFEQHRQSQHRSSNEMRTQAVHVMTKCCHCELIYPSREPLLEHLKASFKDITPFIVYRCALCGRLMENKTGLLSHFRNVHRLSLQSSDVQPVKIIMNAATATSKKPMIKGAGNSISLTAPSSTELSLFECPQCPNVVFNDKSSLKLHLKRRHDVSFWKNANMVTQPRSVEGENGAGKSTMDCRFCKNTFASMTELLRDGGTHLRDGHYVCLLCHNSDYSSQTLLDTHLQRHIKVQSEITKGTTFRCEGHCNMVFPSSADALRHLRSVHMLPLFYCRRCPTNFMNEEDLRSHLRHHANDRANLLSMVSKSPPKAKKRDNNDLARESSPAKQLQLNSNLSFQFRCNKCGVRFQAADDMHVHAVLHKEPKNYLCLECGISFMTITSLGRHLIISHKITNVDKYLRDNPEVNPEKPSELQCSVCHVEFSSKPLLDSHVRTHGLLFLKTKARANVS